MSAIDGWMDDSSGNNIPELGHRRWQLNPTLGKVGFGYCDGVAVETIYDRSGAGATMTLFPGRLPEISRKICLDGTRHGVLR